MSNFADSLAISGIAMSVIFLILTLLVAVIKILVAKWPHVAPPAAATKPSQQGTNPEHVAAIHAALAQYLGKTPEEIRLQNIKPL